MIVIRRARKGLHQVGVSIIFRSRTKAEEGQAALVVLVVEVQPAMYSSSLNRTRMPGLMLWFSAQVCKWYQSHSITAGKSILIVGMLY